MKLNRLAIGRQLKLIPIGYRWAIEIDTYSLLVCDQKRSSQSLTDEQNGSWPFMGGQNTEVLEGSHHMTMDLNFSEFFPSLRRRKGRMVFQNAKVFPFLFELEILFLS